MEESAADYLARTQKQEFEPQNIQQRPSSEMPEPFHGKSFEPDEYGITPQILPFEGHEFEDNEILPMTPEELDLGGQPTVVDENLPGQPQGSFGMNGVQYRYVDGRWTALKPDGAPMNDAEFYELTSQRAQKKPGNVTGQPLLPSRLFEKPTIAQR